MQLSVVVTTFNRAQLLELCLKSLMLTEAPQEEWEIIVIDDGSTDRTEEVLAQLWTEAALHKPHHCHYFRRFLDVGRPSNAGLARNCGIWKAKGNIVAFTDGDCIFCTDAISHTLAWAKEGAGDFLTSGSWYRVTKTSEGSWHLDGPRGAKQSNPWGPWLAARRSILMEIGGFDERFRTYGAEDEDMITRLMRHGQKPERSAQIIAVHLWHEPGAKHANKEQWDKQIKICRSDPNVIRNVGVEWGKLTHQTEGG